MAPPKLTTLGPELLREIRWTIDRVKRMVGGDLRDDERKVPLAPDDYIVKTPTGGIAARSGTTVYGEECDVYKLVGDVTSGELEMEEIEDFAVMVYNLSEDGNIEGDKHVASALLKGGARYALELGGGIGLVGACLQEDHPGRGVKFSIKLGEWDPVNTVWVYDQGDVVTAIDWRYGVPFPDAGATGLFIKRLWIVEGEYYEEDEVKDIWEVVALDCSSPGECGD